MFAQLLQQSWSITCQLAPWLLIGAAVAGGLHRMVPRNFLRRRLSGRTGVIHAVLLGIPLPLCSCAVIPTGIGLKNDGASDGSAVGFFISTPQTGVDSVLVCASFLGWPFAVFKVLVAGVTGLIGGWLVDAAAGPTDRTSDSLRFNAEKSPRVTWLQSARHAIEILRSIWFWVVIGIVLSAAIEVLVPPSSVERLRALPASLAIVMALVISVPLYVCATASVPVAAALVASGLPTGAALVFLMAGPATNVATISSIAGRFGWRTTAIYLGTLVVGSVAAAMAYESLASSWWPNRSLAMATAPTQGHPIHDHTAWWQVGSAVLVSIMFMTFVLRDAKSLWRRRHPRTTERPETPDSGKTADSRSKVRFHVNAIHCQNCVEKIESALRHVDGIESFEVSISDAELCVVGEVNENDIETALANVGFNARRAKS